MIECMTKQIYIAANRLLEWPLCNILKAKPYPLHNEKEDVLNNDILIIDIDDEMIRKSLTGKSFSISTVILSFSPPEKARIDHKLTVFDSQQTFFLQKPFQVKILSELENNSPKGFYKIYKDPLLNLIWHSILSINEEIEGEMLPFQVLLKKIQNVYPKKLTTQDNLRIKDKKEILSRILPNMVRLYIHSLFRDFFHKGDKSGIEGYLATVCWRINNFLGKSDISIYNDYKIALLKTQDSLYYNEINSLKNTRERLEEIRKMFSNMNIETNSQILKDIMLFEEYSNSILTLIEIMKKKVSEFIEGNYSDSKAVVAKGINDIGLKLTGELEKLRKDRERLYMEV